MQRGFLIDMDGVIYRGGQFIAGADEFIHELQISGNPFTFLTNNSQRTRRDVCTRLARMGIEVEETHMFTCAMATARFLARQIAARHGLRHRRRRAAATPCTPTVIRSSITIPITSWWEKDAAFTFEMVEAATRMIANGAKLIATNLDPNCPTQHGLRPGCGAIVAMLETATGLKAFSVGKPSPVMMRAARKELGLATDETTIIGDTMETDILGGVQMGYRTVLVLSGGTRREDLARFAYRPDVIVESIGELCGMEVDLIGEPVEVPSS